MKVPGGALREAWLKRQEEAYRALDKAEAEKRNEATKALAKERTALRHARELLELRLLGLANAVVVRQMLSDCAVAL